MKIWKSKPTWTIDPNPAQLSTWDAPDIPLSQLDSMDFRDLNGKPFPATSKALIYRFPWYLAFLHYWHGFKHWLKHGSWPARILYFPRDKKLDKEIYLEVCQCPQKYMNQYEFLRTE